MWIRPSFGSLVPSQTYLNDQSHSAVVAEILQHQNDTVATSPVDYTFLHFLRLERLLFTASTFYSDCMHVYAHIGRDSGKLSWTWIVAALIRGSFDNWITGG